MTTTHSRAAEQAPVSFGGVLRSEWIKARSLRSTWWLGGSAIVSMALVTAFWTVPNPAPSESNVLDALSAGFFACQILVLLLGAIISTADYENHAISVFIAAVPRRTPIVLAKALLAAIMGLAVTGFATLLSFGASVALHGGGASLADLDVLRILGDLTVYGACITVIASAAGLVFRSTIATFGATLAFLYLVPGVFALVPLDAFRIINDTFPSNAATNFFATNIDPSRLDPLAGVIANLAWTAAWVVFAVLWVKRRNA
jgi:ABC-2 type transport system permease protein